MFSRPYSNKIVNVPSRGIAQPEKNVDYNFTPNGAKQSTCGNNVYQNAAKLVKLNVFCVAQVV
jgi:hypothetical protein